MNPLFRIDFSISDSLKIVRKSVLIYETIISLYLGKLFYASCFPIETYNMLDYIHNAKYYEHREECI